MPAFRMLGPFEVRDTSGVRVLIPRRKQRALLALLLSRAGTTVSIDTIIDSLWGERPPASVRANLHSYVSGLRRLLAGTAPVDLPRPTRTSNGYRMDLGPGEYDVHLFEELSAAGRRALAAGEHALAAERLTRGLGLWRGPVLDDLPVYEWALPFMSRLDEVRLGALEDQAEARLHRIEHDGIALLLVLDPVQTRLGLRKTRLLILNARPGSAGRRG